MSFAGAQGLVVLNTIAQIKSLEPSRRITADTRRRNRNSAAELICVNLRPRCVG